ncbi:MAG: hypothetical protein IKU13_08920 [Clostridia bacterium]|nr:hypothetical protein [Clostridia bacterium]MBR5265465.1 hypothetical protein [Clostridia bacterium]
MYKQTLYGFRSPLVAGIFETFLFLLYTSFIETAAGTELSSFLYYLTITLVFALVSVYIFIGAAVKYEYALLDSELILRKFVMGKIRRIYSVSLVRSSCVYCNKGIRFITTSASETKHLYHIGFIPFAKKCAIVFTDRDGIKRKLIFKPDKELDELIYRVKTAEW